MRANGNNDIVVPALRAAAPGPLTSLASPKPTTALVRPRPARQVSPTSRLLLHRNRHQHKRRSTAAGQLAAAKHDQVAADLGRCDRLGRGACAFPRHFLDLGNSPRFPGNLRPIPDSGGSAQLYSGRHEFANFSNRAIHDAGATSGHAAAASARVYPAYQHDRWSRRLARGGLTGQRLSSRRVSNRLPASTIAGNFGLENGAG